MSERSTTPLQLLNAFAERVDVRKGVPVTSHRPFPVGPALVLFKRGFRTLFQPIINEALKSQVVLNERALNLFQRLLLDYRSVEGATLALRSEFDSRIQQLESEVAALKSASQPGTNGVADPRPNVRADSSKVKS